MLLRVSAGEIAPSSRAAISTPEDWEVHPGDFEGRIARIQDFAGLQIGTSHPQGGNALAADPGQGVVGPDLRVHGTRNVFVADASVFPTSLGVNPHWTIMALGDLAAGFVADA